MHSILHTETEPCGFGPVAILVKFGLWCEQAIVMSHQRYRIIPVGYSLGLSFLYSWATPPTISSYPPAAMATDARKRPYEVVQLREIRETKGGGRTEICNECPETGIRKRSDHGEPFGRLRASGWMGQGLPTQSVE